jgi:F0F1-type ATP synthase assembly protein I
VIIGLSVGLLLFAITFVIAQNLNWGVDAFGFRRSWLVWIIFIIAVGYFEYKLFCKRIYRDGTATQREGNGPWVN